MFHGNLGAIGSRLKRYLLSIKIIKNNVKWEQIKQITFLSPVYYIWKSERVWFQILGTFHDDIAYACISKKPEYLARGVVSLMERTRKYRSSTLPSINQQPSCSAVPPPQTPTPCSPVSCACVCVSLSFLRFLFAVTQLCPSDWSWIYCLPSILNKLRAKSYWTRPDIPSGKRNNNLPSKLRFYPCAVSDNGGLTRTHVRINLTLHVRSRGIMYGTVIRDRVKGDKLIGSSL